MIMILVRIYQRFIIFVNNLNIIIMIFDLEMIRSVYSGLHLKIEAARNYLEGRLCLTEKILYSHLDGSSSHEVIQPRG
jgi:hypothetical protein